MSRLVGSLGRAAAILGIVAIGATALGQAQGRPARRGAPTDWSHSHVVASRFGPDLDKGIASDWRTYNRQFRRDLAQAAAFVPEPLIERFTSAVASRSPVRQAPVRNPVLGAEGTAAHLDWSLNTGGYGPVVGDPAKYSFDITSANCADVIYYTVNQAGSAAAANVIAITNPYTACTGNPLGTTPTVKWALQMPSGTATSAVPSLDGTILYVLESLAGSTILHAIKVGSIAAPTGTYNFGTGAWTGVHVLTAGEQLFALTFATTVNNASSPYLDYTGNQIFFGDSAGKMHRVINTHLSTAAETFLKGFPVQCGTKQLTSPVFASDQVIVSSADGYLYRMDTLAATSVAIRAQQTGTGAAVIGGVSSPVIDVTNGRIITTTGSADVSPGVKGLGVRRLMFAADEAPTSVLAIGAADAFMTTTPALDEGFYSTNSGFIYTTGNSNGGGDTYVIKVPYNGEISTANGFGDLRHSGASQAMQTTSVTVFLSGSASANKEFIYAGASSTASTAYLFVNRFLSNFGGTDAAPVNYTGSFAAPGAGVSSGIVIDNRTGLNITNGSSTANIYYGTKGVGTTTKSTIVQLNQEF